MHGSRTGAPSAPLHRAKIFALIPPVAFSLRLAPGSIFPVALAALFGLAGCATTQSPPRDAIFEPTSAPMSIPTQRTFGPNEIAETMAMIEFCIDLDNEDDRMDRRATDPKAPAPRAINSMLPARSSDLWTKVADSRELYTKKHPELSPLDRTNPAKNGFPPFDSAWTL